MASISCGVIMKSFLNHFENLRLNMVTKLAHGTGTVCCLGKGL